MTLGRVFDAWQGRTTLPPRPVVLSFDDGYRSHVTAALPILAARRWPGMLNLDLSNLAPAWGIGVPGVRKLLAAGWEIDAHSLTHADLASLSGAALAHEVSGSRRQIQRLFGVLPRFFCYPAGRYDAETLAAVKAAGYEGATTTELGLADPRSRSRSPASVSDAATEPPAWRGSSPPSACPSTEVAGPLLVGENPVRRAEPSFAERDELVDTAAELARPATDDAVLLTRDNGPRVAVEATAVSVPSA